MIVRNYNDKIVHSSKKHLCTAVLDNLITIEKSSTSHFPTIQKFAQILADYFIDCTYSRLQEPYATPEVIAYKPYNRLFILLSGDCLTQ